MQKVGRTFKQLPDRLPPPDDCNFGLTETIEPIFQARTYKLLPTNSQQPIIPATIEYNQGFAKGATFALAALGLASGLVLLGMLLAGPKDTPPVQVILPPTPVAPVAPAAEKKSCLLLCFN